MVRLLQRQQQRHVSSAATAPFATGGKASTLPRVRMCISWRKIFAVITIGYAVGIIAVVWTLERLHPSIKRGEKIGHRRTRRNRNPHYHDPMHLIPHDVSKIVQEMQKEVAQRIPEEVLDLAKEVQNEVAELDFSGMVRDVQNEVQELENQFMTWAWKGWENAQEAMPYDEVELVTLPVDILRMQTMEEYMQ